MSTTTAVRTGYVLTSSHALPQDVPATFTTLDAAWLYLASKALPAMRIDADPDELTDDITTVMSNLGRTRLMLADRSTYAVLPADSPIHEDWSDGFARRKDDSAPEAWGSYITDTGALVRMYRGSHNRTRFYDATGTQHGPEQANIAPAVAYAHHHTWVSM